MKHLFTVAGMCIIIASYIKLVGQPAEVTPYIPLATSFLGLGMFVVGVLWAHREACQ